MPRAVVHIDPHLTGKPLSPHEQRIMALISDGLYPEEAAVQAGVTKRNVNTVLARVRSKLGAKNTNHAIHLWTVRYGHKEKERLPETRRSITHRTTIFSEQGDVKVYLTAGLYDDETPRVGELFLNIGLQGSTLRGAFDSWARMVSVALQWGAPIDDIIDKFKHTSFPPAGTTDNKDIPECASIVDYTVRWLERITSGKKV